MVWPTLGSRTAKGHSRTGIVFSSLINFEIQLVLGQRFKLGAFEVKITLVILANRVKNVKRL